MPVLLASLRQHFLFYLQFYIQVTLDKVLMTNDVIVIVINSLCRPFWQTFWPTLVILWVVKVVFCSFTFHSLDKMWADEGWNDSQAAWNNNSIGSMDSLVSSPCKLPDGHWTMWTMSTYLLVCLIQMKKCHCCVKWRSWRSQPGQGVNAR